MINNYEIIEYKSEAHPDTLTDLIVEECATTLDKYYKRKYGKVLHYNVDKAVFLAGDVNIWYGGGEIVKDPCFILAGQATNINEKLKLILTKVIRKTVNKYLPKLESFNIEIRTNNTSQNLNSIAKETEILSNDTSFGVGYYPFSDNEEKVFAIKKELDRMIKEHKIPVGELYKIMLTPKTISISAPLYAQEVKNRESYAHYKKQIEQKLSNYGNIIFNPDFENSYPYLTLCGSSIECGDDGQVGRGNRYNGLITPCRPMTIEAYHGKNNKNHVGKLYSKLAFERAQEIYKKTNKYTEVILVSKIGKPITEYEEYIKQ
ncbi:MAG: methionine adenosyltransferase [Promethearchaeota archaeon]